jgi:signal recognition particle subunit SEC65
VRKSHQVDYSEIDKIASIAARNNCKLLGVVNGLAYADLDHEDKDYPRNEKDVHLLFEIKAENGLKADDVLSNVEQDIEEFENEAQPLADGYQGY